ncbi:MAG: RNA pseudouridine synthase [Bacteroidota bacterium]
MRLTILKETRTWLAIHKPEGLITERNPYESPTVEELVMQYLQEQQRVPFLGIVHRLDRVTSGVLLFAKKKSALKLLNLQFSQRKVQKTYLALVAQEPPKPQATLIHFLEKDQKNKRAIIHQQPHRAGKAVRLRYTTWKKHKQGVILEVHPQTGKFHQIRAQLAAIACPIVGDVKYGSTVEYATPKIALHAWKLRFYDPTISDWQEIVAPDYHFQQLFSG